MEDKEKRKSFEAVGDGLLLAVARLYLHDRRAFVPYSVQTRVISQMVRNSTLATIAEAEGVKGREEGEKLSDAFEVAVALHYIMHGLESLRLWLSALFDKHLDVQAEAERILNPSPEDGLTKQVRGALQMVISQNGGKVTGSTLDLVMRQIVGQLRRSGQGIESNGNGAH